VLAPRSTIDARCHDGDEIPIEERSGDEVRLVHGVDGEGSATTVRIAGDEAAVGNPAFDVTPARLVTAIVTDVGVIPATREGVTRAVG
jgi:methylthioribose-1-phosphate isomerase